MYKRKVELVYGGADRKQHEKKVKKVWWYIRETKQPAIGPQRDIGCVG